MYNFAVDTELLTSVSEELKGYIDKIGPESGNIYNIYNKISEMGKEDWVGNSYDTFSSECTKYKPSLEALVYMLMAFHELTSTTIPTLVEEKIYIPIDSAFSKFCEE